MPHIHSTHTTPTHHALTILHSCIHTAIPTHTIPHSCIHTHTTPTHHAHTILHSRMYTTIPAQTTSTCHAHTIHHSCIHTSTPLPPIMPTPYTTYIYAPPQHPHNTHPPCPPHAPLMYAHYHTHPPIMPTPYPSHIHTTTPTHHAHTIPQSYTHHHTHPSCPHHTPVIHTATPTHHAHTIPQSYIPSHPPIMPTPYPIHPTTPTHHVHTIHHLCIHTTTAPTCYSPFLHTTQSAYRQTHNYVHRQTL